MHSHRKKCTLQYATFKEKCKNKYTMEIQNSASLTAIHVSTTNVTTLDKV